MTQCQVNIDQQESMHLRSIQHQESIIIILDYSDQKYLDFKNDLRNVSTAYYRTNAQTLTAVYFTNYNSL